MYINFNFNDRQAFRICLNMMYNCNIFKSKLWICTFSDKFITISRNMKLMLFINKKY